MFKPPARCPDKSCDNHLAPSEGFLRKRGTYTDSNGRTVQRYQCKKCKGTFTNRTEAPARLQRAQDINRRLFGMVCSGITMRRAAILLGVSYNTVRRRMSWLAIQARAAHDKAMAANRLLTSHALFDEMDTFLHSKAKNLTIAVVVRASTGEILAAQTDRIPSRMPTSPAVAAAGGWSANNGPAARERALRIAAPAIERGAQVSCDSKPSYPKEIRRVLNKPPFSRKVSVKTHVSRKVGKGDFDPLFRLNHVCAKIRADIACMARDTWTTAKSIKALQDKLDIYIAWNNRYWR